MALNIIGKAYFGNELVLTITHTAATDINELPNYLANLYPIENITIVGDPSLRGQASKIVSVKNVHYNSGASGTITVICQPSEITY